MTVNLKNERIKTELPYRLGITGGIGSGKTSVCKVFGVFGIPVFSADPVASEIMEFDPDIRRQLNSIVGIDLPVLRFPGRTAGAFSRHGRHRRHVGEVPRDGLAGDLR